MQLLGQSGLSGYQIEITRGFTFLSAFVKQYLYPFPYRHMNISYIVVFNIYTLQHDVK
jgi:hypothetical protein